MQPIPWRELERHAADILRENGHSLDRNDNSGDVFIIAIPGCSPVPSPLNLTAFVQELADRINGK